MPAAVPATVSLPCPAKLNLFLEVLARRPDGYHDIDTVMVTSGPADHIEASLAPGGAVTLELSFPGGEPDTEVPAGPENLAARAARLLLDEARSREGVRLRLAKRIPAGAGLGGGSSDAAAALRAVNALLGGPVAEERIAAFALSLGSDVPFFLLGGAARARGRGERVEHLPLAGGIRTTVLYPGAPASTAEVYARCRPASPDERRDPAAVMAALAAGDAAALAAACFNRLETPAREVCPPLGPALDLWRRSGERVHMTGSGSACFIVMGPAAGGGRPPRGRPIDLPPGGRVLSEG